MSVRDLDDDILAAFVQKDFADFAEISRNFSNMSDQLWVKPRVLYMSETNLI